jgi:hypothetical protein
MCASEEEAKLVSAGFDGNIMIWDLVSEECQAMYNFTYLANRRIRA